MKKKLIPNIYSLFDTGVLARKLEKMAHKGWHFKEIVPNFLVFEEGEAMELSYATPYFPNNSVLEPTLTEEHEAYLEMCAASGWELVWTYGTRQIFCNTRPDPVPIETDPMVQLQAIGAGVGRYLLNNFVSAAIALPVLFGLLDDFPYGMFDGLSHIPEFRLMGIALFFNAFCGLLKLIWYFVWFHASYNRAKKGKSLLPTLFYPRLILNLVSILLGFAVMFVLLGPIKIAAFLIIALPLDLLWWRYYQNGKKHFKSKEQVYIFLMASHFLIFNLAEKLAAKLINMLP